MNAPAAGSDRQSLRASQRRRGLFNGLALMLGCTLAVLVGETALRLLPSGRVPHSSSERELFCRFDPELGWAPVENVTGFHTGVNRPALVHQNQFGLRGPDDMRLTRTAGGPRRILVLGDSYVWGFGVDQARLFSQVHRPGVEFLNLGVSGYGTDQEYLLYLRLGVRFTVDEVVVALTPYNDIQNNLETAQYGYPKPRFELEGERLVLHAANVRERRPRTLRLWLRRNSRVYALLRNGWLAGERVLWSRQSGTASSTASRAPLVAADITERDRRGVELTVAILRQLRDAAASHGAAFSVVSVPYKPHVDQRVPWNHPLVPLLAEQLGHAGVRCREPYSVFLQAAQAGAHLFNHSDNHFSSEGHALFARFLADWAS